MNLPNKLTVMRVCMIPFFVVFMVVNIFGDPADKYIADAFFIVASLTDFIDGHLARKYNLVTNFGKFMDPLADKLLVSAALICLAGNPIPVWVVIVIISREFIISGLRLIASENGIVLAASMWGKCKTATTMVMIILVIADFSGTIFNVLEQVLIYVSLALTIISMVDYLYKNRQVFAEEKM
jgi:CDP-diacylglycerol--glycerol-3-phosphate 3-phosphatidyltransferase